MRMRMRKKAVAEMKNLRVRHYHPDEPDKNHHKDDPDEPDDPDKDDAPKIEQH